LSQRPTACSTSVISLIFQRTTFSFRSIAAMSAAHRVWQCENEFPCGLPNWGWRDRVCYCSNVYCGNCHLYSPSEGKRNEKLDKNGLGGGHPFALALNRARPAQ